MTSLLLILSDSQQIGYDFSLSCHVDWRHCAVAVKCFAVELVKYTGEVEKWAAGL